MCFQILNLIVIEIDPSLTNDELSILATVIFAYMHLFDSLIGFQFIVSKLDKLNISYNLFVFNLVKQERTLKTYRIFIS